MKKVVEVGLKEYDYVLSICSLFGYKEIKKVQKNNSLLVTVLKDAEETNDPVIYQLEYDFFRKYQKSLSVLPLIVCAALAFLLFTAFLVLSLVNKGADANTKLLYFIFTAVPGFLFLMIATGYSAMRMRRIMNAATAPYPNYEAIKIRMEAMKKHADQEIHS